MNDKNEGTRNSADKVISDAKKKESDHLNGAAQARNHDRKFSAHPGGEGSRTERDLMRVAQQAGQKAKDTAHGSNALMQARHLNDVLKDALGREPTDAEYEAFRDLDADVREQKKAAR